MSYICLCVRVNVVCLVRVNVWLSVYLSVRLDGCLHHRSVHRKRSAWLPSPQTYRPSTWQYLDDGDDGDDDDGDDDGDGENDDHYLS